MVRSVIDLLFPPACPACGCAGANAFCGTCVGEIAWIARACPLCAIPLEGARCARCARCASWSPAFDAARAAARYEGLARDALLRFKLGGERRAAEALAAPMVRLVGPGALTFVPATRRSVAARGFNPAEALARALARGAGRSAVPLLRKTHETADQAGLTRAQRAQNLEAAIEPLGPAPERVVLVDDILTTGATADACARALKRGGAAQVTIVTFARAL